LSSEERAAFERHLSTTIELLTSAGKQVLLTTDSPKFGFDPQRCKFNHPLSGQSSCDESSDSYRLVQSSYVPLFEMVSKRSSRVRLIYLDDLFCDDSVCRMANDGRILFRDNNHVNIFGSQLVGSEVAKQLLLIEPTFDPK
jgi:SGNH domain (fused to AT3 domains)